MSDEGNPKDEPKADGKKKPAVRVKAVCVRRCWVDGELYKEGQEIVMMSDHPSLKHFRAV